MGLFDGKGQREQQQQQRPYSSIVRGNNPRLATLEESDNDGHEDDDESKFSFRVATVMEGDNADDDKGTPHGTNIHHHSPLSTSQSETLEYEEGRGDSFNNNQVPDMWSLPYLGLYSSFAGIGLLYGMSGTMTPFCAYVYKGQPNVCSNANNMITFVWSWKLIYGVVTDCFRPLGLRRRPWMIFGWCGVLVILFILAVFAKQFSTAGWLSTLMMMHGCVLFADVPADGYSVELSKLENAEARGQILITGQRVRFTWTVIGGLLQALFLNGQATNPPDRESWSFGLDINGYYALIFVMVGILVLPVLWLKEPDAHNIPRHSFREFSKEMWDTLQNQTLLFVIIFAIGKMALSALPSIVSQYMKYYVIKLNNVQAGIDVVASYGALAVAIFCFQTYFIKYNWRLTSYLSHVFSAALGLLWLLPYHDIGRTRNPWFGVFIDLDQSFTHGLSHVLYALCVLEIAKNGQESTTFELATSVSNAAKTLSSVFATQFLYPLNCVGCVKKDFTACPASQVSIASEQGFDSTDGPSRFTWYTVVISIVSVFCCLIFTPFLPRSKEQCLDWKRQGEARGRRNVIGATTIALATLTSGYGIVTSLLLLNPKTACLAFVGGKGC